MQASISIQTQDLRSRWLTESYSCRWYTTSHLSQRAYPSRCRFLSVHPRTAGCRWGNTEVCLLNKRRESQTVVGKDNRDALSCRTEAAYVKRSFPPCNRYDRLTWNPTCTVTAACTQWESRQIVCQDLSVDGRWKPCRMKNEKRWGKG